MPDLPPPPPRRVLVVAYYFPPMGLSGVQRVAKFVKYLPEHGWQPTVLTVRPAGYFAYDESLLHEVERAGTEVHRTPSLDPTRLFGRKANVTLPREGVRRNLSAASQALFVPDNKIGWLPFAYRAGRRLLKQRPYDAIFSSAPPYTAHLVAALLARRTGLPLVTDFRDDWVGNPRHVYPTPFHRRLHVALEGWVLRTCRSAVTINPYIQQALRARHRSAGAAPVDVLPQGFDPADFDHAPAARTDGRLRLLYTGIFYDAQTPDPLLRALALLRTRRPDAARIEAVFVGLVPEGSQALARTLGLSDAVRYEGYLPHRAVVRHLQAADVLWMTVGRRPGAEGISTGKVFEYIGARKPILALVPRGAVQDVLAPCEAARIAPPDDVPAIAAALDALLTAWQAGRLPRPAEAFVRQYDRRRLAGDLAERLSCVVQPAAAPPAVRP